MARPSRSNRASVSGEDDVVAAEYLDGDLAAQARVAAAIDVAHPACPERLDDFIRTQSGACREAHRNPSSIQMMATNRSRRVSRALKT